MEVRLERHGRFIDGPPLGFEFPTNAHMANDLDGRENASGEPPQLHWMGWNVGRWEGDTFVVESTGYEDRSWLSDTQPDGGWPHSDEMRVVERWRRLNYGTLEVQITVIDPKTYTAPWVTQAARISLAPGTELWEYFCVPSDFNTFNSDVYLPVANRASRGGGTAPHEK